MFSVCQLIEINDVRCSKKELKQVQSILKKNFKLSLKVRSNLPGTEHMHNVHVHVHDHVCTIIVHTCICTLFIILCIHVHVHIHVCLFFFPSEFKQFMANPPQPFHQPAEVHVHVHVHLYLYIHVHVHVHE